VRALWNYGAVSDGLQADGAVILVDIRVKLGNELVVIKLWRDMIELDAL